MKVQDAVNLPWEQKPWLPSEAAAVDDAAEHLENVKYVLDEKAFEKMVIPQARGLGSSEFESASSALSLQVLEGP